ncbi:MAG: DUF547 domain-containing protein [Gammaproteobacteria bacterium]
MHCVLSLWLAAAGFAQACSGVDPEHAAWSALLSRRVADGRVDYVGFLREDQSTLDNYLATLSATCAEDYARWPRAEKIAFWINAYNAFTVRLIMNHHPLRSIRKIGWLPGAAFRLPFIPMHGLRGGDITLDDIEHRVLRAEFAEPRIHFALVCAARSCPPLRAEAYRGADLERQLDDQGRRFLGDHTRNRVDRETGTLYLSTIFKWFRPDFETRGSLGAFVAPYLDLHASDIANFEIEFLNYDWSLNE